jgi:hypothetical protein
MDKETRLHLALDMLKEVIERDVEIPLKTIGLSMRPFIYGGEWVVVRRAGDAKIYIGDIVIYQSGNTFIAHRVVRRREEGERVYFTVKGDAHLAAEGEISAEQVVAKVVALKKAGRAIDLDQPRWRRANRWIAHYSSWVDTLYTGVPSLPGITGRASGRFLAYLAGRLARFTTRLMIGPWRVAGKAKGVDSPN